MTGAFTKLSLTAYQASAQSESAAKAVTLGL